jgi:TonB-linked SusC/RagA family outer membrane protein
MNVTRVKALIGILVLFLSTSMLNAQSAKIVIDQRQMTLKDLMTQVEKQTSYLFILRDKDVNTAMEVNIKTSSTVVSDILTDALSGTNIRYEFSNNYISLYHQVVPNKAKADDKQFVSGKVTDSAGQPVIGAAVFESGTNNGVQTDLNGNYTIKVNPNAVIEVSCIGFKNVKVDPANGKNVIMDEDKELLDEVVVVGYGSLRRSLVTSAISKMTVDDSKLREVSSPTALLNGRVAGVTSFASSGALGAGERVSIRGASSIQAGNDPLYVVDGIPIDNSSANLYNYGESMSPLAILNVNDVESIEILKDAASAAVYGSRASNGVIIITTKSGKEGKSTLGINISTGLNQFANQGRLKMANTEQWTKQYNLGIDNYNAQTGKSLAHFDPGTTETTDWLSYAVRVGKFLNADFSFAGGTKKTKFYVGGNFNHNEGVIKTNSLDKYNFKMKLVHEFNNWIEVGANTSGNYMKNYQVPGVSIGSMILGRCILQRPFDKPYHDDGTYTVGGTNELSYHNPVAILNEAKTYLEAYRYLGSYYLTLKFLNDKLTFKNSINADVTVNHDYKHYTSLHPYVKTFGLIDANRIIRNITLENVLNYSDEVAKGLDMDAMLGHSFQTLRSNYSYMLGKDFPSDAFDAMGAAASIGEYDGTINQYAMESYFGRVNLSYKKRYTLTGTLRTDGSSKFAKSYRWGWFPSLSFGWIASNEEFMKNSGINLKIRASYGKTGNQEGIGDYAYQAKMSGGYNYNSLGGIAVSDFGNNKLTWEKAGQADVGFDMSLFKDRLSIIFDAYYKKTTDLLYAKPIYTTTGVSSIISNVGSIENKGMELTVGGNLQLGPVHWNTNFNIATNANKILSLVGDEPIIIGGNNSTTYGTQRILKVGEELGAFYLYKHDGIYQDDKDVPAALYKKGYRAGDIKYRDVNGDGNLSDAEDRMVIGSPTPDFQGGWNNTFTFKNWSLDVFFTYMYGNDVYSGQEFNYSRTSYKCNVTEEHAIHYWTPGSGENWYPRFYYNSSLNTLNSDFFLHDGSFIRLRNITLSYNIPSALLKKAHISACRLHFGVDNLFLLSKYPGWDPEVNTNNDARYIGVDNLNVPQPRIYSLGINLSL